MLRSLWKLSHRQLGASRCAIAARNLFACSLLDFTSQTAYTCPASASCVARGSYLVSALGPVPLYAMSGPSGRRNSILSTDYPTYATPHDAHAIHMCSTSTAHARVDVDAHTCTRVTQSVSILDHAGCVRSRELPCISHAFYDFAAVSFRGPPPHSSASAVGY